MLDEDDLFGLGGAEGVIAEFRGILEATWLQARNKILRAEQVSLDDYLWSGKGHMGEPQHYLDRYLHQYGAAQLGRMGFNILLFGEEDRPRSIFLNKEVFPYIGYLDALDGTRQAFSLPGCWSINFVLQRYVGMSGQEPECRPILLGLIDADGSSMLWAPLLGAVDLKTVSSASMMAGNAIVSDQTLISDEMEQGLTGVTTVLVGGYKWKWWPRFEAIRNCLPNIPVFNTAGAPVTRKAIQNPDIVVIEPQASTLWDGMGAGLVAAAGGFVCRLDEHPLRGEPLPQKIVLDWFGQFGYEPDRNDSQEMHERYCIPPFVAGRDGDRVAEVSAKILTGGGLGGL